MWYVLTWYIWLAVPHILHTETLKQRAELQSTAVSLLTLAIFFSNIKDFPADTISCLDWAVLFVLVVAISDRSAICRPLPLFSVDRVVTMHCRLFNLTLVTCQLRRCTRSKNRVIFKRERQSGVKKSFPSAENIPASLKTLLTEGRRQSPQKKTVQFTPPHCEERKKERHGEDQ